MDDALIERVLGPAQKAAWKVFVAHSAEPRSSDSVDDAPTWQRVLVQDFAREIASAIAPVAFAAGFRAGQEKAAELARDKIAERERAAMQNGLFQPEGSEDRACLIFLAGALNGMGQNVEAAILARKVQP